MQRLSHLREVTRSGFDPRWPLSHSLALKESSRVSDSLCLSAQPSPATGREPFPPTQPTKHNSNLICILDLEPTVTAIQFWKP